MATNRKPATEPVAEVLPEQEVEEAPVIQTVTLTPEELAEIEKIAKPATPETEVSTQTIVEDHTEAPEEDPYGGPVRTETIDRGDGTVVENRI